MVGWIRFLQAIFSLTMLIFLTAVVDTAMVKENPLKFTRMEQIRPPFKQPPRPSLVKAFQILKPDNFAMYRIGGKQSLPSSYEKGTVDRRLKIQNINQDIRQIVKSINPLEQKQYALKMARPNKPSSLLLWRKEQQRKRQQQQQQQQKLKKQKQKQQAAANQVKKQKIGLINLNMMLDPSVKRQKLWYPGDSFVQPMSQMQISNGAEGHQLLSQNTHLGPSRPSMSNNIYKKLHQNYMNPVYSRHDIFGQMRGRLPQPNKVVNKPKSQNSYVDALSSLMRSNGANDKNVATTLNFPHASTSFMYNNRNMAAAKGNAALVVSEPYMEEQGYGKRLTRNKQTNKLPKSRPKQNGHYFKSLAETPERRLKQSRVEKAPNKEMMPIRNQEDGTPYMNIGNNVRYDTIVDGDKIHLHRSSLEQADTEKSNENNDHQRETDIRWEKMQNEREERWQKLQKEKEERWENLKNRNFSNNDDSEQRNHETQHEDKPVMMTNTEPNIRHNVGDTRGDLQAQHFSVKPNDNSGGSYDYKTNKEFKNAGYEKDVEVSPNTGTGSNVDQSIYKSRSPATKPEIKIGDESKLVNLEIVDKPQKPTNAPDKKPGEPEKENPAEKNPFNNKPDKPIGEPKPDQEKGQPPEKIPTLEKPDKPVGEPKPDQEKGQPQEELPPEGKPVEEQEKGQPPAEKPDKPIEEPKPDHEKDKPPEIPIEGKPDIGQPKPDQEKGQPPEKIPPLQKPDTPIGEPKPDNEKCQPPEKTLPQEKPDKPIGEPKADGGKCPLVLVPVLEKPEQGKKPPEYTPCKLVQGTESKPDEMSGCQPENTESPKSKEQSMLDKMEKKLASVLSLMEYTEGIHTVEITSSGCDDPPANGEDCDKALGTIIVDGEQVSDNKVGFNIAVLEYPGFKVKEVKTFDTNMDSTKSQKMSSFLLGLQGTNVILVAIKGDVAGAIGQEVWDALVLFGAKPPFEKGRRASLAFIGCRGKCPLPWIQQVQRSATNGPSSIQLVQGVNKEYVSFGGGGSVVYDAIKTVGKSPSSMSEGNNAGIPPGDEQSRITEKASNARQQLIEESKKPSQEIAQSTSHLPQELMGSQELIPEMDHSKLHQTTASYLNRHESGELGLGREEIRTEQSAQGRLPYGRGLHYLDAAKPYEHEKNPGWKNSGDIDSRQNTDKSSERKDPQKHNMYIENSHGAGRGKDSEKYTNHDANDYDKQNYAQTFEKHPSEGVAAKEDHNIEAIPTEAEADNEPFPNDQIAEEIEEIKERGAHGGSHSEYENNRYAIKDKQEAAIGPLEKENAKNERPIDQNKASTYGSKPEASLNSQDNKHENQNAVGSNDNKDASDNKGDRHTAQSELITNSKNRPYKGFENTAPSSTVDKTHDLVQNTNTNNEFHGETESSRENSIRNNHGISGTEDGYVKPNGKEKDSHNLDNEEKANSDKQGIYKEEKSFYEHEKAPHASNNGDRNGKSNKGKEYESNENEKNFESTKDASNVKNDHANDDKYDYQHKNTAALSSNEEKSNRNHEKGSDVSYVNATKDNSNSNSLNNQEPYNDKNSFHGHVDESNKAPNSFGGKDNKDLAPSYTNRVASENRDSEHQSDRDRQHEDQAEYCKHCDIQPEVTFDLKASALASDPPKVKCCKNPAFTPVVEKLKMKMSMDDKIVAPTSVKPMKDIPPQGSAQSQKSASQSQLLSQENRKEENNRNNADQRDNKMNPTAKMFAINKDKLVLLNDATVYDNVKQFAANKMDSSGTQKHTEERPDETQMKSLKNNPDYAKSQAGYEIHEKDDAKHNGNTDEQPSRGTADEKPNSEATIKESKTENITTLVEIINNGMKALRESNFEIGVNNTDRFTEKNENGNQQQEHGNEMKTSKPNFSGNNPGSKESSTAFPAAEGEVKVVQHESDKQPGQGNENNRNIADNDKSADIQQNHEILQEKPDKSDSYERNCELHPDECVREHNSNADENTTERNGQRNNGEVNSSEHNSLESAKSKSECEELYSLPDRPKRRLSRQKLERFKKNCLQNGEHFNPKETRNDDSSASHTNQQNTNTGAHEDNAKLHPADTHEGTSEGDVKELPNLKIDSAGQAGITEDSLKKLSGLKLGSVNLKLDSLLDRDQKATSGYTTMAYSHGAVLPEKKLDEMPDTSETFMSKTARPDFASMTGENQGKASDVSYYFNQKNDVKEKNVLMKAVPEARNIHASSNSQNDVDDQGNIYQLADDLLQKDYAMAFKEASSVLNERVANEQKQLFDNKTSILAKRRLPKQQSKKSVHVLAWQEPQNGKK